MANETLEQTPTATPEPAEALLNSLPVQPMASDSARAFKDIFATPEEMSEDKVPASQKVLNAMLYFVLASALFATGRIFWTAAKELLSAR